MHIRFYATLKDIVRQNEVEVKFNGTVCELLNMLCKDYGERFRSTIFDGSGQLRNYINLIVNGQNIKHLNGMQTILKDNDVMAIFLPIAGG